MSEDPILRDRTAVVTGGHRGIGAAITTALAAAGATVVVGSRDPLAAAEVQAAATRDGANVLALPCDVTEPESVAAFGTAVHERFGTVDIVVANAGIAGAIVAMHEMTPQQWRECIAVDLDGVFLTFRAFLPAMLDRGTGGSLIAIGSITGKRPLRNRTPYAAAKLGVVGLVRTLAEEVGPAGIRVNVVSPGAVDGPRLETVFAGEAAARGISVDEARTAFVQPAALRRVTRDTEVADACVFLASDRASAITGVDLNVAAGLVMY